MSKIAKMLTHTFTGNVRASRDLGMQYASSKFDAREAYGTWGLEKQMRLGVTIQADAFVSDSASSDTVGDVKEAIYDLKRAMIEEIFGEFRPFLIEMRVAMRDEDKSRLRLLLSELEHKMFTEDL